MMIREINFLNINSILNFTLRRDYKKKIPKMAASMSLLINDK